MTIASTPRRRFYLIAGLLILAFLVASCDESSTGISPTGTPAAPMEGYRLQGEVNPTQQAALETLVAASSTPVDVLARGGQIEYLSLGVKISDADAPSAQEKALLFLEQNQDLFRFGNFPQNLRVGQRTSDESGNTLVQLSQQHQGVPVYGSGFLIFVGQDDTIYSAQANYIPDLSLDVQPTVRSIQAEATALDDLNAEDGELTETTTLQIYAPGIWDSTRTTLDPRLAWFVTISSESNMQMWLYIVDAQDGSILERMNLILEAGAQLDLEIWETSLILYEKVFEEDGVEPGKQPSEFSWNAFDHVWDIYSYYYSSYGRVNYTNTSGNIPPLVINVNAGNCLFTGAMAFWNGKYIYFCQDFTEPPDVMNHEYTHAVMGSEVDLVFAGEPREINEAFADIFAAFASPEESIWQLNWPIEDEDGDTILRDLENVKQGFNQDYPIHYTERYCNREDPTCDNKCPLSFGEYKESYPDCGHANSLVFSHAAYLMSDNHDPAAGIPRKKLQYLYYEVMTKRLIPASNHKSTALSLLEACIQNAERTVQFPNLDEPFTVQQCKHIEQALIEVGLIEFEIIHIPPSEITPTPPTPYPAYPFPTPTPVLPDDGEDEPWWSIDIDKIIADLLQKLQDWFNHLVDQMLQTLWQGLLDFLNNLTQQCCLGTVPLIILPSGLLLKRWQRRKNP